MKRKLIMQGAAVLASFVVSCGICCLFFSGLNIFELGIVDRLTAVSAEEGSAVIVIDPGHGGMDGGASSADGVQEKDINLDISKRLQTILDINLAISKALAEKAKAWGAEVIMTRDSDTGLYTDDDRPIRQKKREDLLARKKIIEESGADIAVSIHLNSFPQDASVYGAQVFYPKDSTGRTDVQTDEQSSRDFAESVQKSLETNIDDGRTREAMVKNDIIIFEDIEAKIILVECGFLSNQKECGLLQTSEYQQQMSNAIWEGINEILCLEMTEKIQVIDSANIKK